MKDRGKRNTKEEILNASLDLFSEYGFSAVSVRDITKRVGVNESTLYNHYTNKDEILEVIIDRFRSEFGNAFAVDRNEMSRALAGATPEAFLHHHVMSLRDRMSPRVVKTWRIIYLELFRNSRVREFYMREALRASAKYYEAAFGVMMDTGMIRRADPKVLSDEFNYALTGLQVENLLLQAEGSEMAENAARIFAHIKFICEAVRLKEDAI